MSETDENQNQYEYLCSYDNLELAFSKARRGKTLKSYVLEFEEKLKENLLQLRIELLMQTYNPQPLKTFIIRDPKTRKISKSTFRDRVVHHAICNVIEDNFDKHFIHDSFANRLGKGNLNALNRFDFFKRKVSKNNTIKSFALKADIKHYFETVNHDILLKMLEKRIQDERIIWLIKTILSNYQSSTFGVGMPLGNLTSQFFANVYLNELDQFVKHSLRAKYYIRYVDDFVILHSSRKLLEDHKQKIDQFLVRELALELHPQKSQVLKLDKGINFLGFRIFYHYKLIRKKNMRKFERKLCALERPYKEGIIEREKIIEKFEGWLAYASAGNTYKYQKKLTSRFNQLFPVQPRTNIISPKKHENFNNRLDSSKIDFTFQKTLFLFKKGMTIPQIAEHREIKESTVWNHIAYLVEHHQLPLKSVLSKEKIKKILLNIKSPNDSLKEIKARLNDEQTAYEEINCVLANIKGKHQKKSTSYFIEWYKRVNCFRKCYFNKKQRNECRVKFQILAANSLDMKFTKKEFLDFFNNNVNICVLPEEEKKRFVSWKEFQSKIKKKK